jgi:hypothetical protein
MSKAEFEHLKSDFLSVQLDIARLRAALTEHPDPLQDFEPPSGASPTLVVRCSVNSYSLKVRSKVQNWPK